MAALIPISIVTAEPSTGYLKYQDPAADNHPSILSTVAYVITSLILFAVIIGLAYIASKLLGNKIGKLTGYGDNRILITIPLGANRAVHVIEAAGKFLVIGVTEHTISLLQEITEKEEIAKLKLHRPAEQAVESFNQLFHHHLASLKRMRTQYPAVFGTDQSEQQNELDEKRSK